MLEIIFFLLNIYVIINFLKINSEIKVIRVNPRTEPNRTELEFNRTEPKTEFEYGLVRFTG